MGDAALNIEHIGSTALPGMWAKPIIDLMVAVDDLDGARVWFGDLETLGYEFRPDVEPPDRLFFAKGERALRTHHLSLARTDSDFYFEKMAFRDHLCSDSSAFEEYKELKMRLAERFPDDRKRYTDGKEAFVHEILALAEK